MNPDHLKRLADYLQAEVKLIHDLSDLLPKVEGLSQEDKIKLEERVQKFLEYKNAKLDRVKDEIVWGKELSDVLLKVGDILLQQQSVDAQLQDRAKQLYAQMPANKSSFTPGESRSLVSNYIKMELAQRQGDVFWFAAYVQKQIETLLTHFFNNVSLVDLNADLATQIDFWEYDLSARKSLMRKGMLGEALFTGSYDAHTKAKGVIKAGNGLTDLKAFDFSTKLKYFVWRHEFKSPLRPFAYQFSPPQYLSNARNLDSHGGDPANVANSNEKARLLEIQQNPAKFFILFYQTLHSVHKHFFNYQSL